MDRIWAKGGSAVPSLLLQNLLQPLQTRQGYSLSPREQAVRASLWWSLYFWFCIFKEVFNMGQVILVKVFSAFDGSWMKNRVPRGRICRYVVIVLTILISVPCGGESVQNGIRQKWFKADFGFFMSDKTFGSDYFVNELPTSFNVSSEKKNCVNESRSENSSSLVKLGNSNSFKIHVASQPISKVSTSNTHDSANNTADNNSLHFE
jgi:hypothetical protein